MRGSEVRISCELQKPAEAGTYATAVVLARDFAVVALRQNNAWVSGSNLQRGTNKTHA